MKRFSKLMVVLLTMLMVLECFAMPALATTVDPGTVTEEPVIAETEAPTEPEETPQESTEPSEPSEPSEPTEPEVTPQEPTIVASGTCGEKLTWTMDSEGLLVISGEGEMQRPSSSSIMPWGQLPVKKVVIESGVTSICNGAFSRSNKWLSELTEIELPNTLEHIGSSAFSNSNITEITIPDSVTTIEDYAFSGSQISSVKLPEGITEICDNTFDTCRNLKYVSLPDSLTTIGRAAFSWCRSLPEINFPNNLKTIEADAFSFCFSLESVIVPNSVTTIGASAFHGCSNLKFASLPINLTEIDNHLFYDCVSLEAFILPAKVTVIDNWAFDECDSLKEVYYLGTKKQLKNIKVGTGNDPLLEADWYLATVVTKQPQDVKAAAGKTAKFTTAASRSGVKYQWYYQKPGTETWNACSGDSAKKATLTVNVKANMDGYQYRCVIKDAYGGKAETQSATLTVVPAPKITKQPESAMAKIGETVSVTVDAEGEGLTYLWYYANKGSTSFKKTSETSNTYTIEMNSSRDGRKLYCLVKDKYGQSVKSETVTIYRETTPIEITQQPESVSAKFGDQVTLTVSATGDGLTYTWYYAKAGATKFTKASTTTNTYATTMNTSRDGWRLYCRITDEYGKTVKTDTVTLTLEKTPFNLIKAPEDVTAKYGEEVTLSVEAEGDGLTYTWYYTKAGEKKFTKASSKTNTYSVTMKNAQDGRKVYCVVKDAYGKKIKTDVVTLTLDRTPLALVKAPEDMTVKYGEQVELTVEAEGDGLTYTWYYTKAGEKKFTKASVTTNTYSFTMKKAQNGRKVYCVVKDAYGKKIKTDVITLTLEKTPLEITAQPVSVTVKKGETATVSVEAAGDGLTYVWYYAKAGAKKFTKSSTTTSSYSVVMNADRDGRQLYCLIKDAYGKTIKTEIVSIYMDKAE